MTTAWATNSHMKTRLIQSAKGLVDVNVLVWRVRKVHWCILDSILQLLYPLKNHHLLSFRIVSKNSHNYSKRLWKYSSLPFPTTYLCEIGIYIYIYICIYIYNLIRIIYNSILNTKADMRIQLPSINLNIGEIWKNKAMSLFSLNVSVLET